MHLSASPGAALHHHLLPFSRCGPQFFQEDKGHKQDPSGLLAQSPSLASSRRGRGEMRRGGARLRGSGSRDLRRLLSVAVLFLGIVGLGASSVSPSKALLRP